MTHMKKKRKLTLRTVLLSAVAVLTLTSAAVLFAVNAADEVSQTDLPPVAEEQTPPSDEQAFPSEEIIPDETVELPAETVESLPEKERHDLVVERSAPDFITSNDKTKTGVSYKRFLPNASYQGSYRSQLTANELLVYTGFTSYFVDTQEYDYTVHVPVEFPTPITFALNKTTHEQAVDDDVNLEDLAPVDDCVLSASAAFFYDHPEVFWIRAFNYEIHFYYLASEDYATGYVDKIEISFPRAAYPNAHDQVAAFNTGVAAAVESIRASRLSESRLHTVRAIHDYICDNATYNYDALGRSTYTYGDAYTPTPLFTGKGTFVCEGYSKAFKILCNRFGIPCALVSGMGMTSETSGGPHMWNYVQMDDGKWYGVDSTWDDSVVWEDGIHDLTYFLVGKETTVLNNRTFQKDHLPDGQIMTDPTNFDMIYPPLSETAYNRYIVDTDSPITLTMLGASIRVSDPFGIRFGTQIKRDTGWRALRGRVEFGTIIIASGTLGDQELTINTKSARAIPAQNLYSQDDTQYTFTGVLIGIPQKNFGSKVKGRGYLIYLDPTTQEEHIVYTDTVERTYIGVAQSAYDTYSRIPNPNSSQQAIIGKLKGILGI